MVKGRPPKPTNLLELNGAFKKNPKRKQGRKAEPKGKGKIAEQPVVASKADEIAGGAPDDDFKKAYQLIVDTAPDDVLTGSDAIFVTLLANLLVKVWTGKVKSSDLSLLMTGLGKLGMNPSDRTRLQIAAPKKPKNRWSNVG